jgi:hypothetical protein
VVAWYQIKLLLDLAEEDRACRPDARCLTSRDCLLGDGDDSKITVAIAVLLATFCSLS